MYVVNAQAIGKVQLTALNINNAMKTEERKKGMLDLHSKFDKEDDLFADPERSVKVCFPT
jgi:hypothetical protein